MIACNVPIHPLLTRVLSPFNFPCFEFVISFSVILDSLTHTLGRADENDGGGFHLDHELNGAQPFGCGIFGRNVKDKIKTKIEIKTTTARIRTIREGKQTTLVKLDRSIAENGEKQGCREIALLGLGTRPDLEIGANQQPRQTLFVRLWPTPETRLVLWGLLVGSKVPKRLYGAGTSSLPKQLRVMSWIPG